MKKIRNLSNAICFRQSVYVIIVPFDPDTVPCARPERGPPRASNRLGKDECKAVEVSEHPEGAVDGKTDRLDYRLIFVWSGLRQDWSAVRANSLGAKQADFTYFDAVTERNAKPRLSSSKSS